MTSLLKFKISVCMTGPIDFFIRLKWAWNSATRVKCPMPLLHVNVSGTEVKLSDSHITLGVILDNNHISHLCISSLFHLRPLCRIRPCLTLDMAKSVGVAIVQSRLDYGNPLFFGNSEYNIRKLQNIQNTLACIVVGHPLAASSSELFHNRHWLPVHHHINFKIALLTFKILTRNQPSYLSSLVKFNTAPRPLRSSGQSPSAAQNSHSHWRSCFQFTRT
jgi:hypothetical protein